MTTLKRQKQFKKADAILSADTHLRPDAPTCRTDNFFVAQDKKLDFILDLCKKNDCPLLVAGDFGHKALNNGWPTWFLRHIINKLKDTEVFVIPGQHDLPNHRLDLWKQSGIGVLHEAEAIQVLLNDYRTITVNPSNTFPTSKFVLFPFPYGAKITSIIRNKFEFDVPVVAMSHQMVIENTELWPGQTAQTGHQLLKQFPEYDLILSGDNHNPFVVEYKNRLLVNPGSMMRTTAAQIDHKPRVYLWYAKENKVTPVFLPIEQNVISRAHIEIAEERSERMDAYTKHAREDVEIELSYPDNIKRYLEKHRTQGRVKTKIFAAIG